MHLMRNLLKMNIGRCRQRLVEYFVVVLSVPRMVHRKGNDAEDNKTGNGNDGGGNNINAGGNVRSNKSVGSLKNDMSVKKSKEESTGDNAKNNLKFLGSPILVSQHQHCSPWAIHFCEFFVCLKDKEKKKEDDESPSNQTKD